CAGDVTGELSGRIASDRRRMEGRQVTLIRAWQGNAAEVHPCDFRRPACATASIETPLSGVGSQLVGERPARGARLGRRGDDAARPQGAAKTTGSTIGVTAKTTGSTIGATAVATDRTASTVNMITTHTPKLSFDGFSSALAAT